MSTIPPFPANIDRHDFGNWLSGFVDGEGYFGLELLRRPVVKHKPHLQPLCPHPTFQMALRADDLPILQQIQSFWGCGLIHPARKTSGSVQFKFSVNRIGHLARILVPHFDHHPLRAKKRHDFTIWKEGIELFAHVNGRPIRYHKQSGCSRGNNCRRLTPWEPTELEQYMALAVALKSQRQFIPPVNS